MSDEMKITDGMYLIRLNDEHEPEPAIVSRGAFVSLIDFTNPRRISSCKGIQFLSPIPTPAEIAAKDEALKAALKAMDRWIIEQMHDCPGDTPEPCGYRCLLCDAEAIEPKQINHENGCAFTVVSAALERIGVIWKVYSPDQWVGDFKFESDAQSFVAGQRAVEACREVADDIEGTFSPVELETSETLLSGYRDRLRAALSSIPSQEAK